MNKKERLYISQLIENPILAYPSYYLLSRSMLKNSNLLTALENLHLFTLEYYMPPRDEGELFSYLESGGFAIYKEYYIVGSFGGKIMYLEPNGWKSMNVTKDIFNMQNWLLSTS